MIRKILAVLLLSLVMVVPVLAKVNINTANVEELDTVPEVGPSTATKIITYREANGPFSKIEDIMKVSGIKEATFAKLKDYITVGDDNSSSATDSDNEAGDDSNDADSSDDSLSGHSDSKELTAREKKQTLEIGAGRKRVAVVGAPITFEAVANTGVNQIRFEWSFGDGGAVRGRKATHRYLFPGLYNVVLNGRLGDEAAVARTEVEVVAPELSMEFLAGAVKIANQTAREVNLGAWQIAVGGETFVVPADTLIAAGGAMIIPAEISRLEITEADEIVLRNPVGGVSVTVNGRSEKLAAMQEQLRQLQAQLAQLKRTKVEPLAQNSQGSTLVSSVVQSMATSTTIELPRQTSWWTKLFR